MDRKSLFFLLGLCSATAYGNGPKSETPLSVKTTRNFTFGWINPNDTASCSQEGAGTMLIEVTGEPNLHFSIGPLGDPVMVAKALPAEEESGEIAVTNLELLPSGMGQLDATGFASVEVSLCHAAATGNQKPGFYEIRNFNVQFQYVRD